jgi:acetate kinase
MKYILVINSGSTSLKYKLFDINSFGVIKEGYIENIGSKKVKNHEQALKIVLSNLNTQTPNLVACGHRVVHGGLEFVKPTKVTLAVLKKLKKYNQLAPLHNPPNLAGISACIKLLAKIPNIAVFDTAFYSNLPKKAYIYGLPYKYFKKYTIQRFGFHGTSHKYVAKKAAEKLKKPLNKLNLITCHLGGGASITAIYKGRAIDTSMGFTPLEGVMMMTRAGDIDCGALLYLAKKENLSLSQLDNILNYQSGVLGISGVSSDMREVRKAAKEGNVKAKLALDIFCYRIQKYISAYYGILGDLGALVFTGAIGARSKAIRNKIVKNLKILKGVKILAIPTDEELQIAQEVAKYLNRF